MPKNKAVYQEPESYIPEDLQKKYKVGKYSNLPPIVKTKDKKDEEVSNKDFQEYVKNKK